VIVSRRVAANEINIRVVPDDEQRCKPTITYRRSALPPEGNEEVAKLRECWAKEQRIHWETAINKTVAKDHAHD
jgi:hypothetical protein